MEHLYTLVCDFRGGTYISQVRSIDHIQAVVEWASKFKKDGPIPECSNQVADALCCENNAENVVGLAGLTNAWCHSALCGEDLVLLDIIKTDSK